MIAPRKSGRAAMAALASDRAPCGLALIAPMTGSSQRMFQILLQADYRMKTEAYRSVSNSFVLWTRALARRNHSTIRPEIPSTNSPPSQNPRHRSGTILSVGFGTFSAMTPSMEPARHGLAGSFASTRRHFPSLSKAADFQPKVASSKFLIYATARPTA